MEQGKSKQRDKITEQQQDILTAAIRHPFGMPLCSEDGAGEMGDGFRCAVRGALDNLKIMTE